MDLRSLSRETQLQHLGERPKSRRAVTPPIYQTSLFVYETAEELLGLLQQPQAESEEFQYSRISNPNTRMLERKLAMLEGTEDARVFGSGMAAISAAIMSCVEIGSHIVAVDTIYGPSRNFINTYLDRFNISASYVDGLDVDAIFDSVKDTTKLIYLESPSSIVFRVQDLEKIGRESRSRGITTLIDNSYATPIYQTPADFGIDLMVHSASKYLSGHSDLVAGALCGSKAHLERIFLNEVQYFGGILAPFQAWLMLRGLRTLKLRVKAHQDSANEVASWLNGRPEVQTVNHLGLPTYPQKELVRRQMRGTGGLFSFQTKNQDREYVLRLVNALRIFQIGVSWGGFESLVVPQLVQPMGFEEPTWLIRLFCGLEDPADLIADLSNALAAANG